MTATTIVAIGGGGLSQTRQSPRLHEFLLSLAATTADLLRPHGER
jgi:hypothetical protein